MAITILNGDDIISEAESPLLNGVVRSKSAFGKSVSLIIGFEMAERFCFRGSSSNFVSYLTGPLGQSTAQAAANLNVWYGIVALSPILGAFVADSFLGRYRTIIVASLLYIMILSLLYLQRYMHVFRTWILMYISQGLGFLSLSAALNNSSENSPPPLEKIFFFVSLYLVAFAQGGFKPCVQSFGADQFDVGDKRECEAKSSFFNWWVLFSSLGALLGQLVMNYVQDNLSWELGFGIPCIVMCVGLIIFLLGSTTYRFPINIDETRKNPFVRISRVFVRPTKNCSIDDIEDAKTILRLAPIWFSSLGYSIVYAQYATLFVKQAATMDRDITSTFQIPVASLISCIPLSIVIFIPFYDRVFVPIARSITKKPSGITTLQRIGTGLFLSLVAIVIAALVERKRLATAFEYGLVDMPNETIPMSVWWLAPQYLLLGVTDVFAFVGLPEFFYDQVPSELKSTGLALYLSIFGAGSFLSSFLVSIVEKATSGNGRDGWFSDNLNRGHLDYFYWVLAGISAFAFAAYLYFARSYVYSRRVIV